MSIMKNINMIKNWAKQNKELDSESSLTSLIETTHARKKFFVLELTKKVTTTE